VLDSVSTFDHLIGIHFGPSIGMFLTVCNWILGCPSFSMELFPDLFQELDLLLISFLDLVLSPASSNFAIACVFLFI